MAGKDFPITLTIRALDKASGPLRAMTARLDKITAPFRSFGKTFGDFSKAANLGGVVAGFKGVGSAMSNVGTQAFALGSKIFAMAGVAGFALFSVVKSAVNAGDELAMMADRVGMGVDAFASLRHAANLADVDQEKFNSSMDQFSKRLGQMKANGGPLLAFLNKVSPALGKQLKGVTSTKQGFDLLTDAMSKITDKGKIAALEDAAFGKGGKGMGGWMHGGAAGIQDAQLAYMELVGSQEAFARGAGDLDNAMKNTETAFLGLRSAALGALFPAFTKLANTLTDFMVQNRDGIKQWATDTAAAITAWVQGGGIDRLVAGFKDFAANIAPLFTLIGGLKGVFVAVAAFMAGPLVMAVGGAVSSLVSLGIALAPLAAAVLPFIVAAAPFILAAVGIALAAKAIYDNWDDLGLFFSDLWRDTGDTFARAWAWISPIVDKIANAVALISNPLDALRKGGTLAVNTLLGTGGSALGAEQAKPKGAGSVAVAVDFGNVPKGVKVNAQSTQPLDLSVGRSMLEGT